MGNEMSDYDQEEEQDESFQIMDNLANSVFNQGQTQERAYTLTMICDPEESGLD